MLRPGTPEYLYALSKSQGADQTLAAGYASDSTRNGEPFGELGLVLRGDAAWGDQSGAPRDPQPGNTGGAKVDIGNRPGTAGVTPIYVSAGDSGPAIVSTVDLTYAALAPLIAEAKLLWTDVLGVGDSRLGALDDVQVLIGNLPGDKLGATIGGTILIDTTAADYGWVVDSTPAESSEFAAGYGPSGIDLLTVVMHEFGHVLGFGDLAPHAPSLMSSTLQAGTRVLPDDGSEKGALVAARLQPVHWSYHLTGAVTKKVSSLWDRLTQVFKRDN